MKLYPVKDRLPDDRRNVIVFREGRDSGQLAYYDDVSRLFCLIGGLGYVTDAVYWIEMPKLSELSSLALVADAAIRLVENVGPDLCEYSTSYEAFLQDNSELYAQLLQAVQQLRRQDADMFQNCGHHDCILPLGHKGTHKLASDYD